MAGLDTTTRTVDGDVGAPLGISLLFDDSLFVIELYGELDLAGAPRLEQVIARAEESSAATILVDLSALQFIYLSGIRVLLTASRRPRHRHRQTSVPPRNGTGRATLCPVWIGRASAVCRLTGMRGLTRR